MTTQLLLVRHASVAECYRGKCYGQSDVELGPNGEQESVELSKRLAELPISRVLHSGLQRTRFLAERLAAAIGRDAEPSIALQERDFGDWELKSWNDLYQQFGDEMMRVVSEPATYRPGGGETTFEMRDRVLAWFGSLPTDETTIAITHGGPIAALRGARLGLPVAEWLPLIPACGEVTSVTFGE